MGNIDTKSVQNFLRDSGAVAIKADGDWGPRSKDASRAVLSGYGINTTGWSDERVRLAVEQVILRKLKLYTAKIDGIPGPATQVAVEKWQDQTAFDEAPYAMPTTGLHKNPWPKQNYDSLVRYYGKPGENQVMVTTPYALLLDWDLGTTVSRFSCHKLVKPSIERVLERTLAHYGLEAIAELGLDQFGGCLNVRKMRNGDSWSTHAWGIAIDWDADRNKLRETSRTARMARPEYAPFLDFWEAEGWVSLGRSRNYDWMHVQAAVL